MKNGYSGWSVVEQDVKFGATEIPPPPESIAASLRRAEPPLRGRFGFRFVVFVNGRPKSEIVPILRERLERTREQELATAIDELCAIAEDRWRRS